MQFQLRLWQPGLFFLLLLLCALTQISHAATITIENTDGAGEGFNDPTTFTAIGGNYAPTLGQARLNAFQYAANLVASYIQSNVTIRVDAQMNALGGSAGSATLGQAGPQSMVSDFGTGTASTWYPIALAEALLGSELNNNYDIVAEFNSDVDNSTVLGTTDWYYGLDQSPGSDTDFVTVVLHEILHGLGFLTVMSDSGVMASGQTDVFLNNMEHHSVSTNLPDLGTDAARLTAITDTGNLHWIGTQVTSNSGSLTAGFTGTHVHMYAPASVESGSTASHFSDTVDPDEIMEPDYTAAIHSPGLATYALADIGWSTSIGSGSADLHLALSNSGATFTQNSTYTLTVTNNGSSSAVETTITYMIPTGHTYQTATAAQGSCTQANNIVSCALGDLAASAVTSVTITAKVASVEDRTHAAIVSSATNESNTADNRVADTITPVVVSSFGQDDGGPCFIATAAYGSPLSREVNILRLFRDEFLLTNGPGRRFVKLYYAYSPPIADQLRQSNWLRAVMRGSIGPLLTLSRWLTEGSGEGLARQ